MGVSQLLNFDGGDTSESRLERAARIKQQLSRELGTSALLSAAQAGAYAIDGVVPSIVVRPETPAAVAAALEIATDMRAAVAPWGGGTQLSLGYALARCDIVLLLDRLNAVAMHEPTMGTVTVGAGCTIADLNAALAGTRHFVPLDGPLDHRATVGGRLATGSTGLRRARYGNPREIVQGLHIAKSDGTLLHSGGAVGSDLPGYDLNKLFVGALGTLGIIVEATLKLSPLPVSEATVVAAFEDTSAIWSMLDDLHAGQLPFAALVACGPGCLGAGRGLSDEHADLLQPAAHPLLIARLVGTPLAVRRNALVVRALALKYGARLPLLLNDAPMLDLWSHVEDFPDTLELYPTEAVLKVSVLPSEVGKVIEIVRGFCMEHDLRLGWSADAGAGCAWLRVVGGDADDVERFGTGLRALQEMLARRWRNAIVLGCAPALKQRLALWGADPQNIELMRAIKRHFDPAGILNSGRFAAGM